MNKISIIVISIGFIVSVALGLNAPSLTKTIDQEVLMNLSVDTGAQDSIIDQSRTTIDGDPHQVTKIYVKDQLIGVLSSESALNKRLDKVYKEKYEQDFPKTNLGLGEDVYVLNEQSYFQYENIDEQINDYLETNNLFSILVNKVEISNGAVIYVKNIDDFTQAREDYLLNFISSDVYDLLKKNQTVTPLTTFGEQDISLSVNETISVTEGLAPVDKIYTNKEDIIEFLSYSYGVDKQYYTVKKYQTVQGVALQAPTGLTPQQLITINSDVLKSEDQVLTEGMKLNITYFDSPITVKVVKERLVEENVYPEPTKYIPDASMAVGETVKVTAEVVGKKNVRYYDTYTNGVLSSGEEISSVITTQPVQEVVRVGTDIGFEEYTGSGIGTGYFRYPTNHPHITCGWNCYAGHQAIDVQDRYNLWGNVLASDTGVVYMNSYNSIGGNFIVLNHGNNFYTYYGHMRYRSTIKVGDKVYQGQVIGRIGMTGVATGPHVHFEIWIGKPYSGGHRVKPCSYLAC